MIELIEPEGGVFESTPLMNHSRFRTQVYTSGQVNCVTITDDLTGLWERCDRHFSEHRNRTEAMEMLLEKIAEYEGAHK